ncbi:MAG: hypothetical protein QNJ85_19075 [Gammaproteobacteria bacterium]|nr:hypothetical protein [Gammaproteobacteria bacterium]
MKAVNTRVQCGRLLSLILLLSSLPVSPVAMAADKLAFPERFTFRVASYSVRGADTDLTVLSSQFTGSGFNFASDLGGEEDVDIPRIDGFYRLNERHRIEFGALQIERDGRGRLQIDIDIGDESYSVGDEVVSKIEYDLLKLGYAYSFYHSPEVELSVSLGIDITTYSFEYELSDGTSADESEASGPLPMFGMRLAYRINPRWSLHYLTEVLFVETEDTDGSVQNYEIDLRYRFDRAIVLGAGLTRFSIDVDSEDDEWRGRIADTHQGFLLFGAYYFE